MAKIRIFLVLIALLAVGGWSFAKHFWRGEVLNSSEVKKRWGAESFDEGRFRDGSLPIRAGMAYALLQNKKNYLGKERMQIEKLLGSPDGFYFSDMFPAYMIERGRKAGEDSWQIVFLLNNEQKVSDVIVHQNCCEK